MANLPCELCGSSDAVEEYQDGKYCFSCNKQCSRGRLKLNNDTKRQKNPKNVALIPIIQLWIDWLKLRQLTNKTIDSFNLMFDTLSRSIAYPLKINSEIVGYQLRDENKKISTVRYCDNESPFLFSAEFGDSDAVVVVEDPVSAMRVWQETRLNAVSLLGTSLTAANEHYLLDKYKKIIIWMDGDLPGYKAAVTIKNAFDGFRETRLIYTKSDPKDLSGMEIRLIFGKILGIIK